MKQAPIADGGHTYTLRAAQAASAGGNHAHLPAMSLACCRDGCHQTSLEYLVKHGRTVKHGPDGVKVVAFRQVGSHEARATSTRPAEQRRRELRKALADLGFD